MCTYESLGLKIIVTLSLFFHATQLYFITYPKTKSAYSLSSGNERTHHIPNFHAYGTSQCLPSISAEFIDAAIAAHRTCAQHRPFAHRQKRIGLVTAHFGAQQYPYDEALKTHLFHSLMYGNQAHVLCDPVVSSLWNKPAFILSVLMREMLKPEDQRLEWLMWVDRDTLILDQCRPISSFLPPEPARLDEWMKRTVDSDSAETNTTHLLVNNDANGLNNGIYMIRVSSWAIELFSAILAIPHYRPNVNLCFTEQSAMEEIILDMRFGHKVRFVPQHWFNGYPTGEPEEFVQRVDEQGLGEGDVRRGDFLVHLAGHNYKKGAIKGWLEVLRALPNVWEQKTVQRNISVEVAQFWEKVGSWDGGIRSSSVTYTKSLLTRGLLVVMR
jgi:mannan polymerase II complex MNN10 subunit